VAGYPQDIDALAHHFEISNLPVLTQRFLYNQLNPTSLVPAESLTPNDLPELDGQITVYHSAVATFYAPSDPSGLYGMYRERLQCTPQWCNAGPRRDCAFVVEDQEKAGFKGLSIVHPQLLFSFKHSGITYPCALVQWFN
jgi:hypothetical protein